MHHDMTPVRVAVGAIRNERNEYLISRRPGHVHQGGLWEFPGGKFEPDEDLRTALCRELREELGIRVGRLSPLITIDHDYGDKRVSLRVCVVESFEGEPRGREGQPLRWVPAEALGEYAFPEANRPIVTALRLPDCILITPDPLAEEPGFLERLESRLAKGDVRLLQLRAPSLDDDALFRLAESTVPLARSFGVRVMVNADAALAYSVGAYGAHLNGARLARWNADCRRDGLLLSATAHNRRELEMAREAGVDFVFISPVMPTATHPGMAALGWSGFTELAQNAGMPAYALGGMVPRDVASARERGGRGAAGIRGFWAMAPDSG